MKTHIGSLLLGSIIGGLIVVGEVSAQTGGDYQIYVSNERGGTLTVIDGATLNVQATIPVGKRPRGIHASPDGKTIYVALSGTPISAPPKLDAKGNPIFEKGGDDDELTAKADKAADGIAVLDVATRKIFANTGGLGPGTIRGQQGRHGAIHRQ